MTVSEYSISEEINLNAEDLFFLQNFHKTHVALLKPDKKKGNWKIKTNHFVGTINLPSARTISIIPKVNIANLLYMIAHSYSNVRLSSIIKINKVKNNSPLELYIIILLNWTDVLIKKGTYKNYKKLSNEISGARGKILISRNSMHSEKLWCEFESLTYDNNHNAVLKALLKYITTLDVDRNLKKIAFIYINKFTKIKTVKLDNKLFKSLSFNKLNQAYEPIIDIGSTIFNNTRLGDSFGSNFFSGFMVSMNLVFENFVSKVLRNHFKGDSVRSTRNKKWMLPVNMDDSFIPQIRTDILIEGKLVLDAKYYPNPFKTDSKKYHNTHIYQLTTYMDYYDLSGVLVYPRSLSGPNFDRTYEVAGRQVSIITFDLAQNDINIAINDFVKKIENLIPNRKKRIA